MLPPGDAVALTDSLTQLKEDSSIQIRPERLESIVRLLNALHACRKASTLLVVTYETIFDYLTYLRTMAELLAEHGPMVMFYLAAAVSDFYIPWPELAEHKIQSSDGPLELRLQKVPKMLGKLTHDWTPKAFVVSFKLETDAGILLHKAAGALDNYGVHLVVANVLHTRKDVVTLVEKRAGAVHDTVLRRDPDAVDIERQLVHEVARRHTQFRSDGGASQ